MLGKGKKERKIKTIMGFEPPGDVWNLASVSWGREKDRQIEFLK